MLPHFCPRCIFHQLDALNIPQTLHLEPVLDNFHVQPDKSSVKIQAETISLFPKPRRTKYFLNLFKINKKKKSTFAKT